MAHRNLFEAGNACQLSRLPLVRGVSVGVHENDGDGVDAVGAGAGKLGRKCGNVERMLDAPIGTYTLVRLHDTRVEHLRLDNVLGEDVRPRLRADLELVLEAAGYDEQRRIALALQKRVGGDGRPHFHLADQVGGDGCVRGDAEKPSDRLQRRIVIGAPGSPTAACAPAGDRRVRVQRRR